MIHIDAIYEQGVFRPLSPAPLADRSRVHLTVEAVPQATPDESFYDAASRLGLIGPLAGGPPDLSTKGPHMEGFGQRGS